MAKMYNLKEWLHKHKQVYGSDKSYNYIRRNTSCIKTIIDSQEFEVIRVLSFCFHSPGKTSIKFIANTGEEVLVYKAYDTQILMERRKTRKQKKQSKKKSTTMIDLGKNSNSESLSLRQKMEGKSYEEVQKILISSRGNYNYTENQRPAGFDHHRENDSPIGYETVSLSDYLLYMKFKVASKFLVGKTINKGLYYYECPSCGIPYDCYPDHGKSVICKCGLKQVSVGNALYIWR